MIPIMSSGDEKLESLLNKATNPLNTKEDWLSINGFCDCLNEELEGPIVAVKLLAHKIQSPQEKEALYALTVLEICVQRCGQRFHQEIGKFRFLNEIIKVISPKYRGQYTAERVKQKCIAMLYSWTKGLPNEQKIAEAYSMLKTQGIIKHDPSFTDSKDALPQPPIPVPPPRTTNSIFGQDEEKGKQLSRLLKSRNPADLAAANRMIKTLVKEDNDRVERLSKRMSELETVRNNTKLLNEMLLHYRNNGGAVEDTDIMRELFQTLEAARPNLVRLARETDENDNDGITEILQVNDAALDAIKNFQECNIPEPERQTSASAGNIETPSTKSESTTTKNAIHTDLLGLDNTSPPPYSVNDTNSSHDILSRDLAALGLGITPTPTIPATESTSSNPVSISSSTPAATAALASNSVNQPDSQLLSNIFDSIKKASVPNGAMTGPPPGAPCYVLSQNRSVPAPPPTQTTPSSTAFDDLGLLGKEWVEQKVKAEPKQVPVPPTCVEEDLVDVTSAGGMKYAPLDDPFGQRLRVDLTTIELPITEIRPNTHQVARTLFERPGGLRLQVHFTENRPALRVRVFILALASSSPQLVTDIMLTLEPVSTDIRLELRPPPSDQLAPFNPFVPQVPLNHILLVESPNDMDPIVLRYRLVYSVAGIQECESGESDNLAESVPGAT